MNWPTAESTIEDDIRFYSDDSDGGGQDMEISNATENDQHDESSMLELNDVEDTLEKSQNKPNDRESSGRRSSRPHRRSENFYDYEVVDGDTNDISGDESVDLPDAPIVTDETLQPLQDFFHQQLLQFIINSGGEPRLLKGWSTQVTRRGGGASGGLLDVHYIGPKNKKLRSRVEVAVDLALVPFCRTSSSMSRELLFVASKEFREKHLLSYLLTTTNGVCSEVRQLQRGDVLAFINPSPGSKSEAVDETSHTPRLLPFTANISKDESDVSTLALTPEITTAAGNETETPFFAYGNITVLDWGRISSSPGFHSTNQLFPIGFKCIRQEHDLLLDKVVDCYCEIKSVPYTPLKSENADLDLSTSSSRTVQRPLFRVTVAWKIPVSNGANSSVETVMKVYEGLTPKIVWQMVQSETLGLRDALAPDAVTSEPSSVGQLRSSGSSAMSQEDGNESDGGEDKPVGEVESSDEEETCLRREAMELRRKVIGDRLKQRKVLQTAEAATQMASVGAPKPGPNGKPNGVALGRLALSTIQSTGSSVDSSIEMFVDIGFHRLLEGMADSIGCSKYVFVDARAKAGNRLREGGRKSVVRNHGLMYNKMRLLSKLIQKQMILERQVPLLELKKKKAGEAEARRKTRQENKDTRLQKIAAIQQRKTRLRDLERSVRASRDNVVKDMPRRRAETRAELERQWQEGPPARDAQDIKALAEIVARSDAAAAAGIASILSNGGGESSAFPSIGAVKFPGSGDGFGKLLEVWGMCAIFPDAFGIRGLPKVLKFVESLRTYDSYRKQQSVATVSASSCLAADRLLNQLGMALCRPLMAEFNRIVGIDIAEPYLGPCRIPINSLTWREIARVVLLAGSCRDNGWIDFDITAQIKGRGHTTNPDSIDRRTLKVLRRRMLHRQILVEGGLVPMESRGQPSNTHTPSIGMLSGVLVRLPMPPGKRKEVKAAVTDNGGHSVDTVTEVSVVAMDLDIPDASLVDGGRDNTSIENPMSSDPVLKVEEVSAEPWGHLSEAMQRCYHVLQEILDLPQAVQFIYSLSGVVAQNSSAVSSGAETAAPAVPTQAATSSTGIGIGLSDILQGLSNGVYKDCITAFYRDVVAVLTDYNSFGPETSLLAQAGIKLSANFERIFLERVLTLEKPLGCTHTWCHACREPDDVRGGDRKGVLCDICDGPFHLECALPALTAAPRGEWYCQYCISQKNPLQLHPCRSLAVRRHVDGRVGKVVALRRQLSASAASFEASMKVKFIVEFQYDRAAAPVPVDTIASSSPATSATGTSVVREIWSGSMVRQHAVEVLPMLPSGYSFDDLDTVSGLALGYSGWGQSWGSFLPWASLRCPDLRLDVGLAGPALRKRSDLDIQRRLQRLQLGLEDASDWTDLFHTLAWRCMTSSQTLQDLAVKNEEEGTALSASMYELTQNSVRGFGSELTLGDAVFQQFHSASNVAFVDNGDIDFIVEEEVVAVPEVSNPSLGMVESTDAIKQAPIRKRKRDSFEEPTNVLSKAARAQVTSSTQDEDEEEEMEFDDDFNASGYADVDVASQTLSDVEEDSEWEDFMNSEPPIARSKSQAFKLATAEASNERERTTSMDEIEGDRYGNGQEDEEDVYEREEDDTGSSKEPTAAEIDAQAESKRISRRKGAEDALSTFSLVDEVAYLVPAEEEPEDDLGLAPSHTLGAAPANTFQAVLRGCIPKPGDSQEPFEWYAAWHEKTAEMRRQVLEGMENAPVCAFCGNSESYLASQFVKGQTWLEWEAEEKQAAAIAASKAFGSNNITAYPVTDSPSPACPPPPVENEGEEAAVGVRPSKLWMPYNTTVAEIETANAAPRRLAFHSGSLCVHECCADFVSSARRDFFLREQRKRIHSLHDIINSLVRKKLNPIGSDRDGRTYWIFPGLTALFVSLTGTGDRDEWRAGVVDAAGGQRAEGGVEDCSWSIFSSPDEIGEVMRWLEPYQPSEGKLLVFLSRLFPGAAEMMKVSKPKAALTKSYVAPSLECAANTGSIVDVDGDNEAKALEFPSSVSDKVKQEAVADESDVMEVRDKDAVDDVAEEETELSDLDFEENSFSKQLIVGDFDLSLGSGRRITFDDGDAVLLLDEARGMLWDVEIVKRRSKTEEDVGYLVRFTGWPESFSKWVSSSVLYPKDRRNGAQQDMGRRRNLHQLSSKMPDELATLQASKFINKPWRMRAFAIGSRAISQEYSMANTGEPLHLLRAALDMVEAALPVGSVDDADDRWGNEFVLSWRGALAAACDAASLMECQVMLEYGIRTSWLSPFGAKLLTCMPARYQAIRHATYGLVAIRLWALDQAIRYDKVAQEEVVPAATGAAVVGTGKVNVKAKVQRKKR